MRRVAVALATVFGAGFFPVAPATFASFLTLFLWWWVMSGLTPAAYWAITLAITLLGFWACGEAEKPLGRDAHPIVLDEVAGQLITLAWAPHEYGAVITGFVLFRVLDIWKPPPAYQSQRLPGGFGVVMDDVLAGLYGLGLMRLASLLLAPHHIAL